MKASNRVLSSIALAATIALGNIPVFAFSPLQFECAKDVEIYGDTIKADFESHDAPATKTPPSPHSPVETAKIKATPLTDEDVAATPAPDAPPDIDGLTPVQPEKATAAPKPATADVLKLPEDWEAIEKNHAPGPTSPKAPADAGSGEATEVAADGEKEEKRGTQPDEDVVDPNYFIKRAQAFLKRKDYQSALNYINKALELAPDNWVASFQKAMIYQLAGYDAAAARRYIELIKHRPEMLEAHIGLGTLYCKHNNLDLAVQEYQRAIEISYYSFPAHYNLGNVYMAQNKLADALKEYRQCLKLKPTSAAVHNNIGLLYEKRKYYEEAIEEFQRAAHLEPTNSIFAQNLSNAKVLLSKKPTREVRM